MSSGMFEAVDGYDRLIGRFLPTLAPAFADFASVRDGIALDVGCGPGGLTVELAARLGAERVAAIDPSAPFVAACRERVPGANVVEGVAESLPFADDEFDATLSSLAVGFMSDAAQGVREMARVTRPGGVVALCAWDRRRMQAIGRFWRAVGTATGVPPTDSALVGAQEGDIARLLREAGLTDVESSVVDSAARYTGFDDLWSGYTEGIGPVGKFLGGLDDGAVDAVREALRDDLDDPQGPFTLTATAWAARGTVPA